MSFQDGQVLLGSVTTAPDSQSVANPTPLRATVVVDGATKAVPVWTGSTPVTTNDRVSLISVRGELYVVGTRNVGPYYEELALASGQTISTGTVTNVVGVVGQRRHLVGTSAFARDGSGNWTWTAPDNGVYTFSGLIAFTNALNGARVLIRAYSVTRAITLVQSQGPVDNGANAAGFAGTIYLEQGEVVSFSVRQDSGSNQTIDAATNPSWLGVKLG